MPFRNTAGAQVLPLPRINTRPCGDWPVAIEMPGTARKMSAMNIGVRAFN